MGKFLNQREVTIKFEGRTITGTYTVRSGMITVSNAMASKSMLVGGAGSPVARDGLAKVMLRKLAQEGELTHVAARPYLRAVCMRFHDIHLLFRPSAQGG